MTHKICLLFEKVIWLGTHVSKMPLSVVSVKFIDLFWEEMKHEEERMENNNKIFSANFLTRKLNWREDEEMKVFNIWLWILLQTKWREDKNMRKLYVNLAVKWSYCYNICNLLLLKRPNLYCWHIEHRVVFDKENKFRVTSSSLDYDFSQ